MRQRLFVLGQRMARQIEAEHFLFGRQSLALGPLGHVGQAAPPAAAGSSSVVAEQTLLAAAAIGERRRAGLQRPIDDRHVLRAPARR